jgi:hypothetical protein
MMTTWVLAAALVAEVAGGPSNPAGKNKPINSAEQAMVIPLSGATMTCTKNGDHLVCVIPLEKEIAKESESAPAALPKAKAYKPSQPTLTLPGPEAFAKLKAAEANIELAKALLPKATSPEETVLVQQMLYRARDQYRTARALLHTVQGDLSRAPDPFDGNKHEGDGDTVALCQAQTDLAEDCQTAVP